MPSTFANSLRLENIANGEQSGSWGDTTNKNICGLLVDSIAGTADESRSAVLRFTGNIIAPCTIYIPPSVKTYIIDNLTNPAVPVVDKQYLLIRTTAGAVAATVTPGIYTVYCDGTDTFINTGFSNGGTITGNLAITGNETVTGTLGVTGVTTLKSTLTGVLVGTAGVVSAVAPGTAGNVLTSSGTAWTSTAAPPYFAAGTKLIFPQVTAPTGWTKDVTTAVNDSILRFVTGITGGGSGGSVGVSIWAGQAATGAHTLTIAEMPAHTHGSGATSGVSGLQGQAAQGYVGQGNTGSAGGDAAHTHTLSQNIKYYDAIIASKD